MTVVHVSAECFPVAKVGGLADVVGALPKYLQEHNVDAWVVLPKYDIPWIRKHAFVEVHRGVGHLGNESFDFAIEREAHDILGFPLFVVNIPRRFHRPGIYSDPHSGHGFWDECERNFSFQIAVLDWISAFTAKPDAIHCHDHHTGLIPFLMKCANKYQALRDVPSVLTIHNGQYQGSYEMGKRFLLPGFDWHYAGYLEWHHRLNSLASALKASWAFTTVSPNYLRELQQHSLGLEALIRYELPKGRGILNGIDTEVWNPSTDPTLHANYSVETVNEGKLRNKEELCRRFGLDPSLPTLAFIGRFVAEKGADLLPEFIHTLAARRFAVNVVVLGTGDPWIVQRLNHLRHHAVGFFNAQFEYNEGLAHQIYAGADFLFMPSRVEPCGLNQMYAMRYGTMPIVRSTGGLSDSVRDVGEPDGYGIRFDHFNVDDAAWALARALDEFYKPEKFTALRKKMMTLDFSWSTSAREYANLYHVLKGGTSS